MTPQVAISLGAFVPTIVLSERYSMRVSIAFAVALAIVAPIEIIGLGSTLAANHPIRFLLPAALGAFAFSELLNKRASWGNVPRGYVMALLTFALAGVEVASPFLFVLSGAWIVPGFFLMTCTLICVLALLPKGCLSWLQS